MRPARPLHALRRCIGYILLATSLAFIYDPNEHDQHNRRGEFYWDAYIEEILDQLGLRAERLMPAHLEESLATCHALILGARDGSRWKNALERFIQGGGTLIGFATEGLDDLFGIRDAGNAVATEPFSIAGWMALEGRDEASGILHPLLPATPFAVMSPWRRIRASQAAVLTEVWPVADNESELNACSSIRTPAITRRSIGKGRAFYFAFNVPQAFWTYHHGRRIARDVDGDGYLRTGDRLIVTKQPAAAVPCADLALLILERILAPTCLPFIHQVPPHPDGVPDALFHYGGDDEARDDLQAPMSNIMKSLGVGYHINVMLGSDDKFHFTNADRAVYEANGHEVSLHFNFVDWPNGVRHPAPIPEAEFDRQFHRFLDRYEIKPICVNTHFLRDSGWADFARYASARGILGENIRVHYTLPPMDPVNLFGTPFGTVYPHFVYEDADRGNVRLPFVSVPIGFYEPGSPSGEERHPYRGQDPYRPEEYRRIAELACRYDWTLNVFMHPTHMSNLASRGQQAVSCMHDRIRELGARVLHVGTDALTLWWHARSATRVLQQSASPTTTGYEIRTPSPSGILVRFLASALEHATVKLDRRLARVECRERNGQQWLFVFVPAGEHRLELVRS